MKWLVIILAAAGAAVFIGYVGSGRLTESASAKTLRLSRDAAESCGLPANRVRRKSLNSRKGLVIEVDADQVQIFPDGNKTGIACFKGILRDKGIHYIEDGAQASG
ncbi:MAG: hypothetical protein AB7F98_03480 [Novosphingobium sp.]